MIVGFLAMTLGSLIEIFYLGMVGKLELAAIAFSFPMVMALNGMVIPLLLIEVKSSG